MSDRLSLSDVAGIVGENSAAKDGRPDRISPSELRGDVPKNTNTSAARQLFGLPARAMLGGAADLVGIASNPIASLLNLAGAGINRVTGANIPSIPSSQQTAQMTGNAVGLPNPETPTERVYGDVMRTLTSAAGNVGGAGLLARAAAPAMAAQAPATLAGRVGEAATMRGAGTLLGANPAAQIGAAGGSAMAGGTVREGGGSDIAQFLSALTGGVAGGGLASGLASLDRRLTTAAPMAANPQQLDVRLQLLMRERGVDWNGLPEAVRSAIRREAEGAQRGGGTMNPDALARLASYRAVRDTQPTRGTLTGDPVLLTSERNTAKTAANMSDPALHVLPRREFDNNRALVAALGDVSRQPPAPLADRAAPILGSLQRQYERGQEALSGMYTQARNTEGRYAQLDPAFFNNRVNTLLDESMTGGALPADVRNRINALASGEHPFDVNYVEQFKTQIGNLQRNSSDGTARAALSRVRQALDETPLLGNQGQDAIDAFNRARMLNRTIEGAIERNPAMGFVRQAQRDGVNPAPDSFVEKFILAKGATADNVRTLARSLEGDESARESARAAIVDHLRLKAKIAEDGAGNFSAAGFNGELFKLGRAKLSAFFTPEEVEQLHAIGRVARYETEQPRGSAINNSNSGAMLAGLMTKISNNPLVGALPFGKEAIATPTANVSVRLGNNAAMNVNGVARMPAAPQPGGYTAGLPALTAGMLGLLSAASR